MSGLDLISRVQNIFDAVNFDYRLCRVKGSLSHTWKSRVPAIFLSLARIKPNQKIDNFQEEFSASNFQSTKETIEFFNNYWADSVEIRRGKSKVSRGNYDDFRDHGLMPLVDNGFAVRNTSLLDKNLNGKDTAYRATEEALALLISAENSTWDEKLQRFREIRMASSSSIRPSRLTVTLEGNAFFSLHDDSHNRLQKQIIELMLPKFCPNHRLLYTGDTEERSTYYDAEAVKTLGLELIFSEKKPDIVAHDLKNDWILIIEAVTSTGQINEARKEHFLNMLGIKRDLAVFITAFPDPETFRRFSADIAWETEVWLASDPDHMIHFNGDRFLGPH